MANSENIQIINWITGMDQGWAYQNNAFRMMNELREFHHVLNGNPPTDISIYFDILLHLKFGDRGKFNILHLGGKRPHEELIKKGKENIVKRKFSQYDAVIALNTELFEFAKSLNPHSYLIPNGLDLSIWPYIPRKNNKNFVVGFAGNISSPSYREFKGVDFVQLACKKLGLELKYALFGTNQIPNDRMVEEFYSKIDCLVHPAKSEGSSNVIMEALATGTPVITTHTSGFHGSNMIDGENVLFCERNVDNISKMIMRLKQDPLLIEKLSVNGRKFCEQHHDITRITEAYRQIFMQCLSNGPKQ